MKTFYVFMLMLVFCGSIVSASRSDVVFELELSFQEFAGYTPEFIHSYIRNNVVFNDYEISDKYVTVWFNTPIIMMTWTPQPKIFIATKQQAAILPLHVIIFCLDTYTVAQCQNALINGQEQFTFNIYDVKTTISPIAYQRNNIIESSYSQTLEYQLRVQNELARRSNLTRIQNLFNGAIP